MKTLRVCKNNMGNNRPPFTPDTVFHVYNHGNAEDNIFREEENYRYFLKRYAHYIYPVAKTYAFCLLPNHFHLMVEVRSKEELEEFFKEKNPDLLSNQFKNFLISYAKSFNRKYNRKGSLFLDNINRKPVTNKAYYNRLITYIHQNPVHHGFVEDPADWPFSSFRIMLSRISTRLERQRVLDWFGGKKSFLAFHRQNREIGKEEFY